MRIDSSMDFKKISAVASTMNIDNIHDLPQREIPTKRERVDLWGVWPKPLKSMAIELKMISLTTLTTTS